jgi:hypothetical protein
MGTTFLDLESGRKTFISLVCLRFKTIPAQGYGSGTSEKHTTDVAPQPKEDLEPEPTNHLYHVFLSPFSVNQKKWPKGPGE